jgi:acylpyruvate hydrolase
MKLATLQDDRGTHAVVVIDDRAVNVGDFADVGAVLSAGERGWEAARAAASSTESRPFCSSALRAPVLVPGAIVCVGLNYRSHILEMGRDLPEHPTLFAKLPRSLTGPNDDIVLPAPSAHVDYEAELAVVIGKGGRDISRDAAWGHVAGLSILNDVTARDYQRRSLQWFAGKTFQDSSPWGPWLVTPDEVGDLGTRELALWVNGEERQRANLGDLVFDVPALVADLSAIVEIAPGDIIATGTPGGVGEPQETFLGEGDRVVIRIDGIGELANVCTRRTQ